MGVIVRISKNPYILCHQTEGASKLSRAIPKMMENLYSEKLIGFRLYIGSDCQSEGFWKLMLLTQEISPG